MYFQAAQGAYFQWHNEGATCAFTVYRTQTCASREYLFHYLNNSCNFGYNLKLFHVTSLINFTRHNATQSMRLRFSGFTIEHYTKTVYTERSIRLNRTESLIGYGQTDFSRFSKLLQQSNVCSDHHKICLYPYSNKGFAFSPLYRAYLKIS